MITLKYNIRPFIIDLRFSFFRKIQKQKVPEQRFPSFYSDNYDRPVNIHNENHIVIIFLKRGYYCLQRAFYSNSVPAERYIGRSWYWCRVRDNSRGPNNTVRWEYWCATSAVCNKIILQSTCTRWDLFLREMILQKIYSYDPSNK